MKASVFLENISRILLGNYEVVYNFVRVLCENKAEYHY